MEELARDLPSGYGYDWTGTTYQEKIAGGQSGAIFGMAIVFVFLVLAALYESWAVPFAVLLCIPFAVMGAYGGLALRGMPCENGTANEGSMSPDQRSTNSSSLPPIFSIR